MLRHHLNKLEHFVGSVDSGSIRAYAVKNGLSQPAVSRSIRTLETVLEASLIVRSRTGIRATPTGKSLYEFATTTLLTSDRIYRSSLGGSHLPEGRVRMGTYPSIAVYIVPAFIAYLRSRSVPLKLETMNATSSQLVESLRAGEIDFTVSVDPPETADIESTVLYRDVYSIYEPADWIGAERGGLLFTMPSATDSKGKSIRQYLDEGSSGFDLWHCGDFEATKAMLESGVGRAVLPDRVARRLVQSGRARRSDEYVALTRFGEHSVRFSVRKNRAADSNLVFVRDQLVDFLRFAL